MFADNRIKGIFQIFSKISPLLGGVGVGTKWQIGKRARRKGGKEARWQDGF
jgi:hypothetical protein